MNDTHGDDELDVLMRDWAARQAAPEGKLDDLSRRIAERLNEMRESDDVVISATSVFPPKAALGRGRRRYCSFDCGAHLCRRGRLIHRFHLEQTTSLHANRGDADDKYSFINR